MDNQKKIKYAVFQKVGERYFEMNREKNLKKKGAEELYNFYKKEEPKMKFYLVKITKTLEVLNG